MSFTQHNTNGLIYFTADSFDGCGGVAHGFSTRAGGVSQGPFASLNLGINRGDSRENVLENYRRFCAAVGADVESLVFSHQIHKDGIRVVTSADAGKGLERERDYDADALITDIPGLALVIFTADCIPVLLYDPVRRVVGAAHAGWRSTALSIAEKTARRKAAGGDKNTCLCRILPLCPKRQKQPLPGGKGCLCWQGWGGPLHGHAWSR